MIPADRIDVDRLRAAGLVAGVEHFDELGSTQDRAVERARSDAMPLPHLVVAEQQTAGRGRGANRWWTARGSLAFTLVFDPAGWHASPGPLPTRSLAVGVAVVDAVQPLLPGRRVGLHWPNDVFVEGRKIAGVLVDVLTGGLHVVGVGINVNNPLADAPAEVRARAASLSELAGHSLDRTALLVDVLRRLRALLGGSVEQQALGRRFHELCLQLGQTLTIDVAGRRTTGRCLGILPDGALLLATADGQQAFRSGALVYGSA